MKQILIILSLATLSLLAVACKKEIDVLPDHALVVQGVYEMKRFEYGIQSANLPANNVHGSLIVSRVSKNSITIEIVLVSNGVKQMDDTTGPIIVKSPYLGKYELWASESSGYLGSIENGVITFGTNSAGNKVLFYGEK